MNLNGQCPNRHFADCDICVPNGNELRRREEAKKPGVFWVRDPKAEEALRNVGREIRDKILPEGYGFALLVFPFGQEGGMFYMSNAARADMIKAMEEWIENAKNEP